jgi:hypothetical protein
MFVVVEAPVITLPILIVFYHQKFLQNSNVWVTTKTHSHRALCLSLQYLAPQSTVKFVGGYWTHFTLLFMVFYVVYITDGREKFSIYPPPPLSLSLSLCVCVWGRIVCGSIWVLQVRVHNYLVDSLRLLYN